MALLTMVEAGFGTDRARVSVYILQFWSIRHQLSTEMALFSPDPASWCPSQLTESFIKSCIPLIKASCEPNGELNGLYFDQVYPTTSQCSSKDAQNIKRGCQASARKR